jgi:hypothetical protein
VIWSRERATILDRSRPFGSTLSLETRVVATDMLAQRRDERHERLKQCHLTASCRQVRAPHQFLDVPGSPERWRPRNFLIMASYSLLLRSSLLARQWARQSCTNACFAGPADLECCSRQPPNAAIRALTIFFTIAAGNGLSVEKRIVPLLVSKSVNWSWNAFTTAELIG